MGSLNFYSQLQRAVERAPAKMDGQPAQQWLQWLESNAAKLGVKKEEVEWSGVREYLALQGRQRLFRQDLGAFLQENGVRVSEVVYAGERQRTSTAGDKSGKVSTTAGPVLYSDYALPGGKNYREVLITLPAPAQAIERFKVMGQGPWVPLRDMETGYTVASGTYGEMTREAAKRNAAASGLPDPHKSNHWDVNNVLAHLRVDDRIDDAGKRVLFIQEIQSDWAQEGRSQGFQADKRKPRLVIQEINAGFEVFNESLGRTAQDEDGNDAIFKDRGDAQAMLEQLMKDPYEQASAVPRGPFVGATGDWVGLALKRAIVMAVEGGYDRVALISGEQAADLYKLSSRVSSVTVGSMKDGSWAVSQRMLDDGAPVEHKDLKSIEDVARLVGKDLADRAKKLKPGEFRKFTDVDMKVGGEGMHAFYDRIVPQVANDLLRRLGGTPIQPVRVNAITPEKKVDRLGFDVSDIQIKRGNSGWFVERSEESVRLGEPRYWDGAVWTHDEGQTKLFRTKKSAEASVFSVPQLGFDITPAMREAVMGGVPLFSLASESEVLDNPSTPDAVRDVIADLVGLDAQQLQDGVGRLVVTTSDDVRAQVEAARKAAFDAWFSGSMVVDEEGKPQVMYHGSYRDLDGGVFDRMKSAEVRAVSMDTVGSWFSDNPSEDGGAGMYAQGERARIYPVYLNIQRPKVYATFNDFLRDMHESEGRSMEAQKIAAIGSTEGLRQKLKAQGYDGIAFQRTDNEALRQEISEYQAAVKSARSDEFGVPRQERQMYTVKRERLEQKLKSLVDELNAMGGSTEFDKQYVWVAFEPEQIKSAIGNRGTYDPLEPDILLSAASMESKLLARSKAVDRDGNPLVVFHGTSAKFKLSEFEVGRASKNYSQLGGEMTVKRLGAFFSTSRVMAESFAKGPDAAVLRAHLDVRNPVDLTEGFPLEIWERMGDFLYEWNLADTCYENMWELFDAGLPGATEFVERLRQLGYDGAVLSEAGPAGNFFSSWVVFDSNQIHPVRRLQRKSLNEGIQSSVRAQAFHDRQSGTTFFLADRIPAGKEASVFLHEVVHRHGRTALPQERFEQLVGQVKDWAGHAQGSTERSIHDKAAGRVAAAGVSGPVADEELFAYAVEEAVAMGVQPSALAHEGSAEAWLNAVVQSIQRVADKLIGNSLEQLGGQDLVDLAYALAQVERPELGAEVEQALQEALNPRSPANAASQYGDAPLVSDVFGEQIEVNGTWYHAERIFGRAASTYGIGDPVPQLAQPKVKRDEQPDEVVSAGLFRESGANITDPRKVAEYAEAMRAYGGWGKFPPVAGRVETLSAADLERFEELSAAGCAHELGFSRELKRSDIGMRYVHLENGHHRCHAAHEVGCEIPVFDLHVQERGKDFIQPAKSSDEPVGPGGW